MTTLAEHMIVASADNHPHMLEKTMYTSWSSHVYSLVNHHNIAKEIWDRVKLLMLGKELSQQEHECKLYDEFDRFNSVQVSTKFLNTLPPEWSKFVTDVLDEEQLTFFVDLGVTNGQATQIIITHNATFQTNDLDAYDSDCDDISSAKAVLMANLSSYDSDVLSEYNESFQNNRSCSKLDAPALNEFFVINDLKAQLQAKESLKSKLRAHIATLKGKNVSDNILVNNVCLIAPGMFKLELKPLSHRLKDNRKAHEDYL
uniref:Integrase, catalytic region, zinc finger, CCHC-type, peptidase aspartic, catalytic n=1 Tax=Tanacetum cinerariifolium TaxID=118510 RepID=A0A699H8Z9_TANCI|nr:hypothetical protein [Tanacetum cinerariifolium]